MFLALLRVYVWNIGFGLTFLLIIIHIVSNWISSLMKKLWWAWTHSLSTGYLVTNRSLPLLKFCLPIKGKIRLVLALLWVWLAVPIGKIYLVRMKFLLFLTCVFVLVYKMDILQRYTPFTVLRVSTLVPRLWLLRLFIQLMLHPLLSAMPQLPMELTNLFRLLSFWLWRISHNFLLPWQRESGIRTIVLFYRNILLNGLVFPGGVTLGSATLILKLLVIIPVWIPHTLKEVVAVMSEEELTYVQNLIEADKMELS